MGWATFWATFSQTHLVTLHDRMEEKSYFVNTATHAREVGTYLHTYERK
jgi:hypothetical protein